MTRACLMLKTKDNRRFLTKRDNLPSLKEFAATFGAEIYSVRASEDEKCLELNKLALAICDSTYASKPKCTLVKRVFPEKERTRKNILKVALKIKTYIEEQLTKGKEVSLKELKTKYKSCNVTDACLCNHLAAVRKYFTQQGYLVRKTGAGKYCLDSLKS